MRFVKTNKYKFIIENKIEGKLKDFLIKKGLFDLFVQRCSEDANIKFSIDSNESFNIRGISSAFVWNNTKEDRVFWDRLSDEYYESLR